MLFGKAQNGVAGDLFDLVLWSITLTVTLFLKKKYYALLRKIMVLCAKGIGMFFAPVVGKSCLVPDNFVQNGINSFLMRENTINQYINYDLPENKELFDWFGTKLEDQSFLLYLDEIKRLIKENKYEMKDGQFVDKTIRTDKLFGDVRQNLENFYNSFDRQFYFDDFGFFCCQ